MPIAFNRWTRKLHRWGALLMALPLLIVIVSGLLLQLKKQVPWVQPSTERGTATIPLLSMNEILGIAKSVKESEVNSWDDIDRLDIRPDRGLIKIRGRNRWELQIDSATGEVLASNYRRSDFIESIHDGSFFSDTAKLWLFLPNGIVLLCLWFTGAWLWYLPFYAKRKKKKRVQGQRVPAKK